MTAVRAPLVAVGAFSRWQPLYAGLRIPTFPVDMAMTVEGKPAKRPLVRNYARIGLPASAELAIKRRTADGIGFMAERAGITVLDVDTTDRAILTQLQERFGPSRFVVQTASGKFHAYYQHDGEGRLIRPDPELPFDILGAGLVIGAGSICDLGEYRIIKGEFDDLACLKPMNEAAARYRGTAQIQPAKENRRHLRAGDGRNRALFDHLMKQAPHCDDLEALLDVARSFADREFEDLMPEAEVLAVATSAWSYQTSGMNWKGRKEKVVAFDSTHLNSLIAADPNAWVLFSVLKDQHSGSREPFVIANAMAGEAWAGNMSRRALQNARNVLITMGIVRVVRRYSSFHGPALFQFAV